MTTQKAARASPELRRAPLRPRYRRNYTTPRGTTMDFGSCAAIGKRKPHFWVLRCTHVAA